MRLISTLMFACFTGFAAAQAPFTIVRPVDGAKVREKVKIEIPKNSVPPGGYVGIFLNGRFLEAVVPTPSGKFYSYTLDTKARGLADGKTKIELALYVDYNDQPKIVDRSSVNVTIANKANIPIPSEGLRLRYVFTPGTQTAYAVEHRMSASTVTQGQASRKGRAADLLVDAQSFQMIYAVDNAYSDGDGLLRIQMQPPKGKRSLFLATSRHPDGSIWREEQFGEMYMRTTNTGNEVFGSVPVMFPLEGTGAGPGSGTQVYFLEALPSLPSKSIHIGDVWQSRYQHDAMTEGSIHNLNSLVSPIPVRGEFVGVEWEMGHPCAKIHQAISAGGLAAQGKGDFATDRVGIDQTYWFALDKGVVVKFIDRMTIDRPTGVAAQVQSSGSGGGAALPAGAPTTRQPAPARGGGTRRGGGGGGADDSAQPKLPIDLRQIRRGGQAAQPKAPPVADPRDQQRTNQTPAVSQFFRLSIEDVYVLEG